ncbi:MAG: ABC transporter substrate-binding protein, partial [Hyphomicrobiales bacterium]|nr:ABC transporter substrate-binding protein [Hyphomicrobiales bacterium]
YSTEALDAGKLFQAAGLPFISPGATDPAVPAEVGDMMFYAAYGDDAQAAAMALFARNKLDFDAVAVWIDERRTYTKTIGRFFQDSFKTLGGTVALVQSDDSADGFADFLTKIESLTPAPQAIYAATFPSDGPDMIKTARDAGVGLPLLSADGWDEDTIVAASKAESLGDIYFTTHRFIGVDTPAMSAFVEAYTSKYGEAPPSAFAPLGFDSVNLLADAIRRAGSTDPGDVQAALAATTDFEGVVGKIAYAPG